MAYELPVDPEALPLRRAYPFLEANGLQAEGQNIRTSKDQFGSYTSTLKRAKVVALLSNKNLLDAFVTEHWQQGAGDHGRREIKRLLRIYERWAETGGETSENGDKEDEDSGSEFALEEHLRDYLAENLHVLEVGMTLWPLGENEDAVEFPVDDSNRRIDILARDKNGIPTVIELKVSRGHEKTIGQSLYYRARVKELLKAGKARIVIVAGEISPELKAATTDLQDVLLFEYSLSMSLKKV
jgi:hypothetical protein